MRISDWSSDVCSSDLLDEAGFSQTTIMAYSTKFASALYGPFREAGGSALKGDRKSYQMNPMNRREALRESLLDEQEGADALMVKPAGAYLDIIRDIRQASNLPLSAYQVSGEYAMRSEEKTSELQSLMRIAYAGLC